MHPHLAPAVRVAGFWLLVALFVSLQNIAVGASRDRPIDWQWDVAHELIYWLVWAAFTPLVVRGADRWPLGRGVGVRGLLPHLAVMLPVGALQISVSYGIHLGGLSVLALIPPGAAANWVEARGPGIVWGTFTGAVYYWVIVGVYHAFVYQRLYRAERLAAAELETRLARAQLDSLRAQLQPHFLFNTLNAISVLTADELDVDLGRDAGDALVPSFLLQPLVENAIRHGIERRPEGGRITVRGCRRGDIVELEVRDTGPGLGSDSAPTGVGIGLANARARLTHLYGTGYRLALEDIPGEGTAVKIAIPFRCAS